MGVDIEREDMLTLGLAVPSFLLNDAIASQTRPLVIRNHRNAAFKGTLKIEAPAQFRVAAAQTDIAVPSGEEATIDLTASIASKGEKGVFPLALTLLREDGTVESTSKTTLEYLGNRERVIVKAVEDAHVAVAWATTNRGGDKAMMVDGGDRKLGDHHHSIAYMKFRLPAKGKIVAATLRIHNAGNPTGKSGDVCLVSEPWTEKAITYATRPKPGDVLGSIGPVTENQVVLLPLKIDLAGKAELSLVIEPTGCDGVDYLSRESGKGPELVLDVEP